MLVEYAFFYRDTSIFTAMVVQNIRFSKSIYSGIVGLGELNRVNDINISGINVGLLELATFLRKIVFFVFVLTYIKFCINLLFLKKIEIAKILRKYNTKLIIFMFSLGTFQQWYFLWMFATLFWQKPKMIRSIITLTLASEIGNTIYMFNTENYLYDAFFIFITAMLLFTWIIWDKVFIDKIKVK